jgi:hypothetical protein
MDDILVAQHSVLVNLLEIDHPADTAPTGSAALRNVRARSPVSNVLEGKR